MKRMRFRRILAVTVTLALIMALAPVQSAYGGPKIKTITKTLPSDGTDVTVTLKPTKDLILSEVMVDSTPTQKADLCNPQGSQCFECDFRIVSVVVDGGELKEGRFPRTYGNNDRISSRPLLGKALSDMFLPLNAKKKLVLTLDTENGNNDVKIKFTFLYEGGGSPVKLF